MRIELLHPAPHTPLRRSLDGIFRHASRVQLAVAFLTGPGVAAFLRLVPPGAARNGSRAVASIRWPTSINALAELAAEMPRGVYLHRGLLLPEETNHDRPLMHSKVVYVEHAGSDEVDILVGSHNWTGQALDGNNLEASVHVRCRDSEPFAADTRRHLDACFAGGELFDQDRVEDYLAIQAALHGGPPRPGGDEVGFVKESVVVMHAEEEPGLTARLGELHLYLPIYTSDDDRLFDKDQLIHLYVYERGRLFSNYDPHQLPALYVGRVEMSNRPNDPVRRRADCMIGDFDRPALAGLAGDIPADSRPRSRQLVAVLRPGRRGRIHFYHQGSGGPRFRRDVHGRPPTGDELGRMTEEASPAGRRPSQVGAYTRESIAPDGGFVYQIPADPDIRCVISLPGRELYPTDAEADFLARVRSIRDEERSRSRVTFEDGRTSRRYVYRCTHWADMDPAG
jgi:hypothetical protein